MYVEAALIGVGAYILFKDLPETIRTKSIKHSWIPHLAVFTGLFLMHGGSAEGTVIAGIATVIFRWLMHRASPRDDVPSKPWFSETRLLTPEEYKARTREIERDTWIETAVILAFGLLALVFMGVV